MAKQNVSPGIYTSVVDLTSVVASVGITTLGLVGETLKGPAFEPILIKNGNEFLTRFGNQSVEKFSNGTPKYELSYIANEYLSQSNQLYVTRILGLSGYNAGDAWTIKANAALDPNTVTVTNTSTGSTTFTSTTVNTIFSDSYIESIKASFGTLPITLLNSGSTFTISSGNTLTKLVNNTFKASGITLSVSSITTGNTGSAIYTITEYSGTQYADVDNMVLAVLRSRASYNVDTLKFSTTGLTLSNVSNINPYGIFTINVNNTDTYDVSLLNTSQNYINKVLGVTSNDKNTKVFIEEVNANLLKSLVDSNKILSLKATVDKITNINNYISIYKTPETPWIVSDLNGNKVENLFKISSISDGNSANKEIKISFTNMNFDSKEFDVAIRDFNDTDANPTVLEKFTRCSMQIGSQNYIANKIGTIDGEYELRSKFIYLEMNKNHSNTAIPSGFEGYSTKNYGTGSTPSMLYKKAYTSNDRINKVYLGLSDSVGIDQTRFNYLGENISTGKTKGFHMDSGATIAGSFEVGATSFSSESALIGTSLERSRDRKFTVLPAGGFDGWDIYRNERTNRDFYRSNQLRFSAFTLTNPSDYYAYLEGYRTFANPEEIAINLFATPGIDYEINNALVSEVIEMIEDERADTLYVVTTPDQEDSPVACETMADVIDAANIDSAYTCTYAPWIQHFDTQNGVYTFISPTLEVLRNMAFTDNTKAPWFAPAGPSRGKIKAKKSRSKLNEEKSKTLYDARINPIRSFGGDGLKAMGQKTLQINESALDRINVVRLILQLRKLVAVASVRLLFEPNDTSLQDQFVTLMNPILNTVKQQRGVYDFHITCDPSNNSPESIDRLELNGMIQVKPTRAAEVINIQFGLTPTSASFQIA